MRAVEFSPNKADLLPWLLLNCITDEPSRRNPLSTAQVKSGRATGSSSSSLSSSSLPWESKFKRSGLLSSNNSLGPSVPRSCSGGGGSTKLTATHRKTQKKDGWRTGDSGRHEGNAECNHCFKSSCHSIAHRARIACNAELYSMLVGEECAHDLTSVQILRPSTLPTVRCQPCFCLCIKLGRG